ncbi:MAG TPA: SAF domain-containing protein, partial [Afifellaceae bacterium]|nr:SAF domain-containing protein [Afifellaceae bacterium]
MSLRIVVLAIALVAGLMAAYLTMNMQSSPPPAEIVALAPQIQSRDVLVAARDITPGSALSRENVRWLAWPEEGVSSTFIAKSERPQ